MWDKPTKLRFSNSLIIKVLGLHLSFFLFRRKYVCRFNDVIISTRPNFRHLTRRRRGSRNQNDGRRRGAVRHVTLSGSGTMCRFRSPFLLLVQGWGPDSPDEGGPLPTRRPGPQTTKTLRSEGENLDPFYVTSLLSSLEDLHHKSE